MYVTEGPTSGLELWFYFLQIIYRLDRNKPGHILQSMWELRLQCLSPALLLPFMAICQCLTQKHTHCFIEHVLQQTNMFLWQTPLSPKCFSVGNRKLQVQFLRSFLWNSQRNLDFFQKKKKKLKMKKGCLFHVVAIKYAYSSISILPACFLSCA